MKVKKGRPERQKTNWQTIYRNKEEGEKQSGEGSSKKSYRKGEIRVCIADNEDIKRKMKKRVAS